MSINYPIEEQINDCLKCLGIEGENAWDMSEEELAEAEAQVSQFFCWVSHPSYVQAVPIHRVFGVYVWQLAELMG